MVIGKYHISWIYWYNKDMTFWDSGIRLNGGGYLYSACPYTFWRIGPVMVKKYLY